ncbi:MAG: flagellar export chaperone FliS [Treponema sp.]|nr:flagellar export chaperone FliS [Treponema sp.]
MGYSANNGFKAYQEIGVKTASQGSLVVMLYEGAVSRLEEAIALVDDENKVKPGDIEKFGQKVQKASDIISELEASLDMEKGGDIAKNLMSLYIFFNKQLLSVSLSHDKRTLESVHKMLADLLNSWIPAANSLANTQVQMAADTPAISING